MDAAYRSVELYRAGVEAVECLYQSRAETLENARVAGYDPRTNLGGLLVAHRDGNTARLSFADVRLRIGNVPSEPIEVDDYKSAGDNGNGAQFLLERYLRRNRAVFCMDELKVFAAHAIVTAAQLNPEGIEGLEVMLCHNEGPFQRIASGELEELSRRSAAVDDIIRRELFSTHI